MSPIGRIFIVINLALSAVFLGVASNVLSTTQDFKTKYEEEQALHSETKKGLEDQLAALNVDLNAERTEKDRYRNQADENKSSVERLEAELEEAKTQGRQMRGQLTTLSSGIDNIGDRLSQVSADSERSQTRALEMERERNDAVQAQNDAERALRKAQAEVSDLETALGDVRSELAMAKAEAESLNVTLAAAVEAYDIDLETLVAVPLIEGAVIGVRDDLVALNVGSNAKVQRGMAFDVYSGSDLQYKGRVRVVNVENDICSALVEIAAKDQSISAGDQATTQL